MRVRGAWTTVVVVAAIAAAACSCGGAPDSSQGTAVPSISIPTDVGIEDHSGPLVDTSVVLFTKTAGFRHDSIEPAVAALEARLTRAGATVSTTDDDHALVADLPGAQVVVFVSTTGDVLDDASQEALHRWVLDGGGWVGIHGALDAEYEWPAYEDLVGAWFLAHPAVQPATVVVEDPRHPSMTGLDATWVRTDEWYDLRRNPRPDVHVIATVDESSYQGGGMGADHPIAWCRDLGAGHTFVTAMGHTVESWSDPAFVDHVVGGIASVTDEGACPSG